MILKYRSTILVMSAMVVFITTYMLILPALTLDKDKAKDSGGIDVPEAAQMMGTETAAEPEETDPDATADAAGPEAGTAAGGDASRDADVKEDRTRPDGAIEPPRGSGTIACDSGDHKVSIDYGKGSGLNGDTTVSSEEILSGDKDFARYESAALAAVREASGAETATLEMVRFFDITLQDEGEETEPSDPVDVTIDFAEKTKVSGEGDFYILHFTKDRKGKLSAAVLDEEDSGFDVAKNRLRGVNFTAESFSVYGVVYTVDFGFEFDGETRTLSIKGGDAIGLRQLLQELAICGDEEAAEAFMERIESVEFSDPELLWVGKVDEDTTTGQLMYENELVPEYSYGTTDQEFCRTYVREFKAPDWAMISLRPFDSEEALTITMKDGSQILISVKDASNVADAIMIDDGEGGQKAQTITNPSGTTIDLFDYWITDSLRDSAGMNGWPGHTGDAFSSWSFDHYNYYGVRQNGGVPMSYDPDTGDMYVNNDHLRGNGNGQGINLGHVFKFYPGAQGTVVDTGDKGSHIHGTNNAWTTNHDRYESINSWTGDADPTTGLIEKTLNADGYPQLTNDPSKGTDGTSLSYLFNDNDIYGSGSTYQAGKQKYGGVDNLLYVDSEGYYTYNSSFYSAQYADGNFTIREHDPNAADQAKGFWPFGSRVNWHGMHMTTEFSMPVDGKVLNPKGEYKDMQFEFFGDDDTWLFVDGVLIGDGGGIHNKTEIDINFATGQVVVTGKEDDSHQGSYEYTDTLYNIFKTVKGEANIDPDEWIDVNGDGTPDTFAPGTEHTFEMFYLERGGSESNLYIRYNLVSTTDFSAHKSYHNTDRLLRDQFRFEIIGYDANGKRAIMPAKGDVNGRGTVESPKKVYYPDEGYTSLITGVTEDGNVNFGDLQLQMAQLGESYRYEVREVVPDDAVNMDGVRWGDATDEEKEEGGFVLDNVTYDGKVYYFIGTVQETYPGSGKYEMKKTRYTDSTYSVIDEETKFFSFVNGRVPPLSFDLIKKSDSGKRLSGAEFSLTHAKHEEFAAGDDETAVRWVPRENATPRTGTTAQGRLTFSGLTEGHFVLEETAPPAGYEMIGSGKWLLTLTKEDSADEILLIPSIVPLNEDGTVVEGAEPVVLETLEHTFEYEVLNEKLPRGDIVVEKKWLRADGQTEYTAEELEELEVSGTEITGELWRRYTEDATDPVVRIFAKLDNQDDYALRWQGEIRSGSDITYSMAVNSTGYPMSTTTSTGAVPVQAPDQNITYDNGINKPSGHVYTLAGVTQDTDIYVVFDNTKANNLGIGFYLVSKVDPDGSTGSDPIEEKVGDFTLDQDNGWTVTWTSEQLAEHDYDYEYYLKNVSEPDLEGFTFVSTPQVSTDTSTGKVTYSVKNIKEGEKTDLTVRKSWLDGDSNHEGDTISYKIRRMDYDASGARVGSPYDYVPAGQAAAEIFTLGAGDTYLGQNWQQHHVGLPADNGKDTADPDYRYYEYSVVEVSADEDYTASYEKITAVSGSETYPVTVIRNEPADERITVEKKWMDPDRTAEITTGIPEGAYITGKLRRSYTEEEADAVTVTVNFRTWSQGHTNPPYEYRTYTDVARGSVFYLWTFDGNGNEPRGGVFVDGEPMAHNGPARTYPMDDDPYGWKVTKNAFVATADDDMTILCDWEYDEGFQTRVIYEVEYDEATGGGASQEVTEDVGTFRLSEENGWKWAWTDRVLDTDREYTYTITDVQEHLADGTVVANFDGFAAPDVGTLTEDDNGKWSCTIVNEQELTEVPVKIHKVDAETGEALPGAKFRLTQVDEDGYDLPGGIVTEELETNGDGEILFENILPGRYRLEETVTPAGYVRLEGPFYIDVTADGDDTVEGGTTSITYELEGEDHVYTVENEPGAALPHTGGPGTTLITLLGLMLLFGCGSVLIARRRSA